MSHSLVPLQALTTSVIVVDPSMRRILCVRHPRLNKWLFPGGHIEEGELPHDAALRELREEVGISATLIDWCDLPIWSEAGNSRLPAPFAMIEEGVPRGTGTAERYVDFVYVGLAKHLSLALETKIVDAGWFDSEGLALLDATFPIREMANVVLQRLPSLLHNIRHGIDAIAEPNAPKARW
jgi:8-oxo-dGTP pyrophosphatase MutT (NUDIX family)